MKPKIHVTISTNVESPSLRGRGLKRLLALRAHPEIESPPARGRGLKPTERRIKSHGTQSPPARGRGLKRVVIVVALADIRRPPHGGVD